MADSPELQGRTVLLVEDESLVSMLAEDILADAGCTVLLAMRLAEALESAESSDIDLAVLDVNLGGGTNSYPVARALQARGIPFLFATGYGAQGVPAEFAPAPVVQKPYKAADLLQAARLLASTGPGEQRQLFPSGASRA